MRISVLASSYPRYKGDGVAPFVKSISEALHTRGHHVEVVAPYDVNVIQNSESKVNVHRFRYIWPNKWHIMGHARSLDADVKLKPLTIFLLPLYVIAATMMLWRVSRKMKADLIHSHWVLPNGLPAAISSKILKIPFVISLHGSDIFMADKNALFRAVARWIFSQSSCVTACSQELYDRAKNINPHINVHLMAWGADPDVFKPLENRKEIRNKYGWEQNDVIVASLGRFVYKKGFDRLISILPDLIEENKHVRLVIGGSGPLAQEFNEQVETLNIQEYVSFPGQIPWHEVPEFLAAADIFVLPSQRDLAGNLDGLPTVLLEAMACGLPCVASNIGGVGLVILEQQNGLIFDPSDQKTLKNYLKQLISSPGLRDQLGQNARQSTIEKFNWNTVSVNFEKLFRQISLKTNNKRLGQFYRKTYLKQMGKDFGGDNVLDIGCHSDAWLSTINANIRIGLDIDPGIPSKTVSVVKADGSEMPFSDNSFDVIYLLDVIEHLNDDKRLAQEILRVLSRNGKLILTTPQKSIQITPKFLTGWVSKKWGHIYRRGYEKKELAEYFDKNTIINIYELKAKWYRRLYFPLRVIFIISKKLTDAILKFIVNEELKDPYGSKGFLLVEVTKK